MEPFKQRKITFLHLSLLLWLLLGCVKKQDNRAVESELDDIKQLFAPDARIALFNYELRGNILKGETNNRSAKEALVSYLAKNNLGILDSLRLLPSFELGADTLAHINVSVANIRAEPREAAELSTQALLGTPVKVLEKIGSWIRVQTPDGYLGYVENSAISFEEWHGTKVVYKAPYGFSYIGNSLNSQHISDLTFGNLLVLLNQNKRFSEVLYPDGRKAFVPNEHLIPISDYIKSTKTDELLENGEQLMGVPYLWGGTSFKGVDCSGFTRTTFMMNGIYLPRDASQQAVVGDNIATDKGFDNLRKGDLLFFGRMANNKPKVTHVAIYLGNLKFIHSSGMVKYGSFEKTSPYYDAYNLSRFLHAKRILGSQNVRKLNPNKFY